MKRRSFIRNLAAVPFLGLIFRPLTSAQQCPDENPQCRDHYRGYHLIWTGWKNAQNSTLVVAQWLGYPDKNHAELPYLYSNSGGIADSYVKGQTFKLDIKQGRTAFLEEFFLAGKQTDLSISEELESHNALAIKHKQLTLDALKDLIDSNYK